MIEKFIMAHKGFNTEKSMIITDRLSNALTFFKNSIRSNMNAPYMIDNSALISAVQKIVNPM